MCCAVINVYRPAAVAERGKEQSLSMKQREEGEEGTSVDRP